MVRKQKESDGFGLFLALVEIAFWPVVGIVFLGSSMYLGSHLPPCSANYHDTPIYSLTLGNQLSGSFFLGIGGLQTNPQYYFYAEQQGGKILRTEYAKYVVIQERNQTPVFREYDGCNIKDELIVPIGTVKVQYDVSTEQLNK